MPCLHRLGVAATTDQRLALTGLQIEHCHLRVVEPGRGRNREQHSLPPRQHRREEMTGLVLFRIRSGALTHYEASQLPQLPRLEFDALLKRREIDEHAYDVEDLERDLETLERLGPLA